MLCGILADTSMILSTFFILAISETVKFDTSFWLDNKVPSMSEQRILKFDFFRGIRFFIEKCAQNDYVKKYIFLKVGQTKLVFFMAM